MYFMILSIYVYNFLVAILKTAFKCSLLIQGKYFFAGLLQFIGNLFKKKGFYKQNALFLRYRLLKYFFKIFVYDRKIPV